MVPMNRPLLDLVRERIDQGLVEAKRVPITCSLGAWLGVFAPPESWVYPTGVRNYLDVAEAGIVFSVTTDAKAKSYFKDGVNWLRQRRFFVAGQPAGLEADPLALLAISIGLKSACADIDAMTWLKGIIEEAIGKENDDNRTELLKFGLALTDSGVPNWSIALSPLLRVSIARKLKHEIAPDIRHAALRAILNTDNLQPEWALFQAAALDVLFAFEFAVDFLHPTIQQLVDLLRGVPAALKRWPWEETPKTKRKDVTAQRWDIQHEYHVQSLLWTVLRPVFPDLEDEENLPSVGHKHPRADILIPGLHVVIEVKYLRDATQSARAKIIEEVAADTGLYLTDDTNYKNIVVFIWDATGSTHHHDELAGGIRKFRGITDVIIVARPGEWNDRIV